MNPTVDVLEKRVAALEGGVAALAVGSGQAASAMCIQNLAQAGDNIVASTDLYGGTVNLFKNTLRQQGIEVRFADPADPKTLKKLLMIKQELTTVSLVQILIFVCSQSKKFQISVEKRYSFNHR